MILEQNFSMRQKMRFRLDISAQHYQLYYQGSARFVHVQSEDGRTLKFPASGLRPFVSHSGIHGRFEITFDEHHKLVSLVRIA